MVDLTCLDLTGAITADCLQGLPLATNVHEGVAELACLAFRAAASSLPVSETHAMQ